jgi:hypothetical protein
MSRAEPKRKQLSLGVGKYYNPVTSRASLKHNARVAFLQAVENKTPEVLNSLHHDVWHFYESIYWRVSAPESEEDWLYSIHPGIVSDWFTGRPAANWTPRSRPALNRLKKALFAWASNYNIFAGWTIMYALDAMMFWAAYQSFPDHRRMGRWLRTEDDLQSRSYGIQQTWGIGTRWYFEKRELRRFEYPNWQGEEEDDYRDRVDQQFKLHLQRYMSEIRKQASTLPKIPKISKPERFEMLALYLCRGMNREQIAKRREFSKDVTVIYRDIREAAQMIDLPLRPRGRPRKKLQGKHSK